jgi:rhamnosyltransferase
VKSELSEKSSTITEPPRADLSRVAVILTSWNSEHYFDLFPGPLLQQGIKPDQVLIIDSESRDNTAERARSFGFRVHVIPRNEFNHGTSRALAATMVPWADFLVYTTPDAIMAEPDTLEKLVAVFADPEVGAAFGRQLPHATADHFARHACDLNYPEKSIIRDFESRRSLGFKTIFFSNNLGAYRRSALEAVGSFPAGIITAEDSYVAAKMTLKGWKTAYVAEARVYHSHNLSLTQVFRRYFDTGVLHVRESWLRKEFGEPGGEGLRFVRAEIAYLWKARPSLIPMVFLRTAFKYAGYQLGKRERSIAPGLKRRLGNLREFWS